MNRALPHEPDDVGTADIPPLQPHLIVLVGATGDLARRKLLPGLLHLIRSGLLPDCRIVGAAMDDIGDDEFREVVRAACDGFARTPLSPLEWSALSDRITYASLAHGSSDLVSRVRDAEAALVGEVAARFERDAGGVLRRALAAAADVDAVAGFAAVARERGWCRPVMVEEAVLEVVAGRVLAGSVGR